MSFTSNEAVRLVDEDGTPIDDSAGRLKVAIDDATFSGDINVHLTAATDDVLIYGYDYSSANQKLKVDPSGYITVNQATPVRTITSLTSSVECIQDTPADLTATVTQASAVRTISGTVTVSATDLDIRDLTAGDDKVSVFGNTAASGLGTAKALLTDADGHLQVDVLSAPTITVDLGSNNDVTVTSGTSIATYPQFDVDTSVLQLSNGTATGATLTTCKEIIIQCAWENTGYIVVGDSGIVAAAGVDSMNGIRLEAGDTLTLAATTVANIYVRGSAADQLVNVMTIV